MNDSNPNSQTFYQSRYYDDVFGHRFNFPVPTSQTKDKSRKLEFKQKVIELLDIAKKEGWPYKDRLTITVEITGSDAAYIKRVDIDNILKLLLDVLKKRVFIE